MTEKAKKYLSDILMAIELIETFTESISDFDEFVSDLKTQSAVERQLGIVGEAVNKYGKEEEKRTLEHAEKIVGFRNRIIHAYDAVDSAIIWTIIKRHLLPLKHEVQEKLN